MGESDRFLVGMLGGPSTGKSTLAREIAEEYDGEVVEEQLQDFWEENHQNRKLTDSQLIAVALLQLDAESQATSQVVVSDTTPITAEAYAHYYHSEASTELKELSSECGSRYDLLLLCDTDIPFEDDGVRSGDGTREEIQRHTLEILERENISYKKVSGTVEQRLESVREFIPSVN